MNEVFKGLTDPAKRQPLDALRAHNGQKLGEFSKNLDMTRQSVTQQLGRSEDANLVAAIRRGGEEVHYLNAVRVHEIYEGWIEKYERQRLGESRDLKKRAEGD